MANIDLDYGETLGAGFGRRGERDFDLSGRFGDWNLAADHGGVQPQAGPLTLLDQFNVSGFAPVGVGFDGRAGEIAVYGGFQTTVSRYDTAGTLLGTFANPGGASNDYDLDYASETFEMNGVDVAVGSVLVFDGETGPAEIYAVDPSSGTVIATLNTTFGNGTLVGGAYHAERGTFFLVDYINDTVSEIDATTGATLNSFVVAFDVFYGDIDVDPVSGDLFLVSSSETGIYRVTADGVFVEELALPAGIGPLAGIALNDIMAGDGYVVDFNGNGAVYHLSGFANINTQSGSGAADTLTGGGGADSLTGLGGDDVLDGKASLDTLNGGAGNDSLVGGAGVDMMLGSGNDDTLAGGAGADTLNGGSGIDWADYSGGGKVKADLKSPGANTGDAEGDVYLGIENLRGSSGKDKLSGGNDANRIEGLGGNDAISARDGNDTLVGGAGKDKLTGGTGDDRFVLDSALAADAETLTDFSGNDEIALLGSAFGLNPGALGAGKFALGTTAGDANDRIIYDQASGKLFFDADGAGAQAQVQIATLSNNAVLASTDFIVI